MITITSNIDEFLTRYRRKIINFKLVLENLAYKLAQRISEDMSWKIHNLRFLWTEDGKLDTISNILFNIELIGPNSVNVSIGDNLPRFEMKDGALVNPIFFIEFGFGIVGENNPKKNHSQYGWEYNINEHETAWFYYGKNGEKLRSEGREGTNFMYDTMQEYVVLWREYFNQLLMEYGNGVV